MKKTFFLFAFISLCILINLSNISVANNRNWAELTQAERYEYIDSSIEDIKIIDDIRIDNINEILRQDFQITSSKDPNYRMHKSEKTILPGVGVKVQKNGYLIAKAYAFTTGENQRVPILNGYSLVKGNVEVFFTQNGSLKKIKIKSTQSSYGTYIVQEFDKSKKLLSTIYYDFPYEIHFDEKWNVTMVKYHGKAYTVKGKIIKESR